MSALSLLIQTGTLYASGESSTFVGTGGPFGFSPFTSQFGGVVTTRGLAREAFNDTVYSVAAGDEVIFVVAVQNFTPGLRAYELGFRVVAPPGFVAPAEGINLSVTDGAGTDLAFTGDLFGGGVRLAGPVAAMDLDSGLNVVLATYTLVAGPGVPGPYATLVSTAAVNHVTIAPGGLDQGIGVYAETTVVTAAPTPVVLAETSPAAVAKGQSIAFDVSVAIPAGTMRDVRLDTLLPGGTSRLKLVSVAVTGVGSGLRTGTPAVGTDGGVSFGTVTSTGDPANNSLALRVVVQADGSTTGTALLQTVLSSAGTDPAAERWSATVGSSVGVVVPPSPPSIAGSWSGQAVPPGTALHPLGGLVLSDVDPAGTATLAVTLRDPGLGRLGNGGTAGNLDTRGATFAISGTLAALQDAVRHLVYTPSAAGTQQFTVTLVDPAGGVAQDASTTVNVAGSAADPVQVAGGTSLWLPVLRGTIVLRGQGATLLADQVGGTPTVAGFGARDSLVLPGGGTGFTYAAANGTLSVGGSTLAFAGTYDESRFQVAPMAPGTVVVTFRADPLFDGDYYLVRNPDVAAAGVDPYQHYLANGWREGRAASPMFDTAFYLRRNPDVAAAGVNPLLHYESNGWMEGRDPSASFSDRDYLAANADVAAAGMNPLLHYVVAGQAEGRAAFSVSTQPMNQLLDLASYYATNPDVRAAGAEANSHYLAVGWREGRNPNAFFDSSYYLTQNPDVRAAGINPLLHFEANGWLEGRQPSLMFDDARYLAAYPEVRAAGLNPLVDYLQTGRLAGRASFLLGGQAGADPLVNANYYDAQLGATLIPTGSAAVQQAAFGYDHGGWQRGLDPGPWFDTRYYLTANPDVAAAHVNPLQHYEMFGWREGRNPTAGFDVGKYLQAYVDVKAAGMDPLLHYVVNGSQEGRQAFTV